MTFHTLHFYGNFIIQTWLIVVFLHARRPPRGVARRFRGPGVAHTVRRRAPGVRRSAEPVVVRFLFNDVQVDLHLAVQLHQLGRKLRQLLLVLLKLLLDVCNE